MLAIQNGLGARLDLVQRLMQARERSDEIVAIVRPDCLYERPISERHRIVFYLGHLEAFDWNLLGDRVFGRKSPNPEFDHLFAFGIDPMGGGLPSDGPSDWPVVQTVRNYVRDVRRTLDQLLANAVVDASAAGADGFSLDALLHVAVEHRLMHVETLAYMLHQLPLHQKIPQAARLKLESPQAENRMMEIPAGTATLGLAREEGSFGWDNEYESQRMDVPAFAIDEHKVTNGEYLEFLNSGGYENRGLWKDDDWEWRTNQGISHPVFWRRDGKRWLYRAMFEEVPLPLEWPVYVSHAEASAFAIWKGKSLPTEAEWHRAAYGATDGSERAYPWGNDAPAANFGNFDMGNWNPMAVHSFPDGTSALGVRGMLGNGWEWTASEFTAFPGFTPFPFYPGYSANFFDGKHFVMKGGSARTAACMLRRSFRNWFQGHYQYMYTGFRCVSR